MKVQGKRMKRHNDLCARLSSMAKRKKWMVLREQSYVYHGRKLRPDLVLIKNGVALLVDATVRYEMDEGSLYKAAKEKESKYGVLSKVVMQEHNVTSVRVFGFPIGARGLWHPPNYALLRVMGIGRTAARKWAKITCERVILGSLKILRDFYSKRGGSSLA